MTPLVISNHGQEIYVAELYNSSTMCVQGFLLTKNRGGKELDFHPSSFMAVIISDNILDRKIFFQSAIIIPVKWVFSPFYDQNMVNLVLIIMILTIHCFDLEVRKTLKWPDSRGKELNRNQSGDTI